MKTQVMDFVITAMKLLFRKMRQISSLEEEE
jgi:hypothetical protein